MPAKNPRSLDRHYRPAFLVRPTREELAAWKAYAVSRGLALGTAIREAMAVAMNAKSPPTR